MDAKAATPPGKRKRRWFQFSLRVLMLIAAGIDIGSWYASGVKKSLTAEYEDEKAAVDALRHAGVRVAQTESGPLWIRWLLFGKDRDVLLRAVDITIDPDCRRITGDKDRTMSLLKRLKKLELVSFVAEGMHSNFDIEFGPSDIERELPNVSVMMDTQ
jgi:hypothetical protein